MALAAGPPPADRRRADHGTRRDDPGADPRPAAPATRRARHGDAVHHARSRGDRRDRRRRGGDVPRPAGRAGRRADHLFAPRAPLHPGPPACRPRLDQTFHRLPTVEDYLAGEVDGDPATSTTPRPGDVGPTPISDATAPALLEVVDLSVHFRARGGWLRRGAPGRPGGRRRLLHHPQGAHPRPGRRVGLRQDHDRSGDSPAHARSGTRGPVPCPGEAARCLRCRRPCRLPLRIARDDRDRTIRCRVLDVSRRGGSAQPLMAGMISSPYAASVPSWSSCIR